MMKIFRLIRDNLPIQLVLIILLTALFGDYLPIPVKQLFLTISSIIKEILIFVLPFVIFSYLFSCLLSFQSGAFIFVLSLLASVILFNFTGVMVAYGIGNIVADHLSGIGSAVPGCDDLLLPLIKFNLPSLVSNDQALLGGLVIGLVVVVLRSGLFCTVPGKVFSFVRSEGIVDFSQKLKGYAFYFLNNLFIPFVPLFIFGFILKMHHEGMLGFVIRNYGAVFLMIVFVQVVWISTMYLIGANFNLGKVVTYIRNMFPALVTGLSTMSGAAAMPMTLAASEKNTGSQRIAQAVIPSTVGIHLMGDVFAIPLLVFTTMLSFGMPFPELANYIPFAWAFVLMMFAIAAVPGGAILSLIIVFEQHLGFTGEMVSLITAVYLLFDSVGSMMNIAGNGAFVIIYNRVFGRFIR